MTTKKRVKCDECGGKIIRKRIEYKIYGVVVGKFPAEICNNCKEICFDEGVSKEITKRTKEMGLWGLETRTRIGVVGSTLDIRLTKRLIDFLKLKKGEEVSIYPEDKHKLIVEIESIKK